MSVLEKSIMKELIILSGPSGSGVSSSKFVFEELGYYVIDGAPANITQALLDECAIKNDAKGFCLMPRIGGAKHAVEVARKDKRFKTTFILLTTEKDELIKRYALSRHAHPRSIMHKMSLEDAINLDIKDALDLVGLSDYEIDTTRLTTKELRINLYNKLQNKDSENITKITFVSFGLKNGIPVGLDAMFDVRLIPNPYWIARLAPLNGADKEVIDYMLSFDVTNDLLKQIVDYLEYYIPEMQKNGRASYTIGIACSGGQHRSTFVANYLKDHFKDRYNVETYHRDSPELNK